jgi:hypothetical protein
MKICRMINVLTVILIVTMTNITKAGNINLNKTFKNDTTIYIFDKTSSLNNLKLNATPYRPSLQSVSSASLSETETCAENWSSL